MAGMARAWYYGPAIPPVTSRVLHMVSKAQKRAAALAKAQAGTQAAQAPAPAAAAAVAAVTQAPAAKAAPGVIQLTPPGNGAAVNLRGARQAWYAHLAAHNGQPAAAFIANALAKPPSTPTRGHLAGKCEPPAGWLRWFVKNGYCVVVQPAAAPAAQAPNA